MLFNIIYKCRTAGGSHFLTFLKALRPFLCLKCSGHIAAQAYFNKIGKSQLLHRCSPACHGDVLTELAFAGRCQHGNYLFAFTDCVNYVYDTGLGSNRSERTIMDTLPALDTLGFVDLAYAVLIHGDCTDRAALHTGPLDFYDSRIGTCLRTFTAALTFFGIDVGTIISNGNRAEIT